MVLTFVIHSPKNERYAVMLMALRRHTLHSALTGADTLIITGFCLGYTLLNGYSVTPEDAAAPASCRPRDGSAADRSAVALVSARSHDCSSGSFSSLVKSSMRSTVMIALAHFVTGVVAFQNGLHAAAVLCQRRRLPAPRDTRDSSSSLPRPHLHAYGPAGRGSEIAGHLRWGCRCGKRPRGRRRWRCGRVLSGVY